MFEAYQEDGARLLKAGTPLLVVATSGVNAGKRKYARLDMEFYIIYSEHESPWIIRILTELDFH